MPQEGQFGSGSSGGSGTVTNVTGTTNQIDVATGTTTPAISQDPVALAGQAPFGGTTAGSATVQTVTVPNLPTAIATGIKISFASGFASTGATTLTVTPTGQSAYAAINLMKRGVSGPQALSASGDLIANNIYVALYDGTQWVLEGTSSEVYTAGTLSTGGMIRGNAQNQVTGSTGIVSSNGTAFTTYNSESSLPAPGVAYLKGITTQKNETTTADANVLTVTPAAAVGTYRVSIAVSVSAATAGVIAWTLSWTDSNGTAQANIAMPIFQFGTAAPNTTFTTSVAGNYFGDAVIDINNAAASIIVKWVGGGTTTAKMSATIERLA